MPVEIAECFTDLPHPYYEFLVNGYGDSFMQFREFFQALRPFSGSSRIAELRGEQMEKWFVPRTEN